MGVTIVTDSPLLNLSNALFSTRTAVGDLQNHMMQVADDDGSQVVELKHLACALYEQDNGFGKLLWSEILCTEGVTEIRDEVIREIDENEILAGFFKRVKSDPRVLLRARLGINERFSSHHMQLPLSQQVQMLLERADVLARELGRTQAGTGEVLYVILRLLNETNEKTLTPEIAPLLGLINPDNLNNYLAQTYGRLPRTN